MAAPQRLAESLTPERLAHMSRIAVKDEATRSVVKVLRFTVEAVVILAVILLANALLENRAKTVIEEACRLAAAQLPNATDRAVLIRTTPACAAVVRVW